MVLAMQAMYGDEFIGTEEAIDVWFALLHDLDYQILSKALQKHMLTNKFKPTVAELREIYADLICPGYFGLERGLGESQQGYWTLWDVSDRGSYGEF